MCRNNRRVREIKKEEETEDFLYIGSVGAQKKHPQEDWVEILQVMENPRFYMKFKLDTAAQASIIPNNWFERIRNKLSYVSPLLS